MKKSGIKNILITGGSGKVGKAVIPQLLQAGYKLRAIQLREESVDVDGVETITGTLSDESLVEDAVREMDAIIHLANVKENRDTFIEVNIKGTFYLLDAAMRCGMKRVLGKILLKQEFMVARAALM